MSAEQLQYDSNHRQHRQKTLSCSSANEGCLLFLRQLFWFTPAPLSLVFGWIAVSDLSSSASVVCVFPKLISIHFLSTCRFADSIRGMLKLILVLMLAGASLSSTWFTLTCLSRVTHLPSTAGGWKAASLSGWHWCVQLRECEQR